MKSEKHVSSYVESVIDLIGDTPLISLKESTGYNIFAKAEFLNPGGSIKDRIALGMLRDAHANRPDASFVPDQRSMLRNTAVDQHGGSFSLSLVQTAGVEC